MRASHLRHWSCGKGSVDKGTLRRERADGIGGGGISCEEKGLAAAAAEILGAAVAGFAGFVHPVFTAEFLKCFAGFPDFLYGFFFHIVEAQAGNDAGGVAGHGGAAWSDEDYFTCPTAHARLGKFRVVIRDNIFDFDFAAEAFLGLFEEVERVHELFASGKKLVAIGEGPAVILHVSKFNA